LHARYAGVVSERTVQYVARAARHCCASWQARYAVVVSERAVGSIMRGLVVLVMASAVVATWAVRVTLTPKSGTFYGLLVYIPVLAAPGWLVWKNPLKPRFLAIWAVVGWLSSIAWFMFGTPYEWERKLAGWNTIELALLVAVAIVLLAVPIAAFVIAGYNRRGSLIEPTQERIARRLRRIAQVAFALGVVAVALSLVPFEVKQGGNIAVGVAIFVALVLAPGALVLRAPRRAWAWVWSAWTLPIIAYSSFSGIDTDPTLPTTWTLSLAACSTIYVLLLAVMPLVCLLTKDRVDPLPEARTR